MQGQDHTQGILAAFALIGYEGACPPPGAGLHHYTFQLFALDQMQRSNLGLRSMV
jgi:phosphatidylethanolamine-binding protein (PEBP) family uncharacterized protein